MEHDATLRVAYVFIDRDGRKGRTSFRLPFSVSAATAMSYAISFAPAISGMVDAVLQSIDIYYSADVIGWIAPLTGESVNTKALLFYRNGDTIERQELPAPKAELFETSGILVGVRVNPLASEMGAWVNPPQSVLALQTTVEGEPFPTEYVVGGKAL